ncbi:MAG: L-histidine N(alpha)-methyltransferase [Chitinivibrionales bacterium]|nr:L-histidine N(alpha)-methyltransferase [Chitinivibrionales bacterium]
MNPNKTSSYSRQTVVIEDVLSRIDNARISEIIIDGLTAPQMYINSMFFYDDTGSKLFEEITHLPEYYPPKIEKQLLQEASPALGDTLSDIDLVELGSGDCSKISLLLNAIPWYERESVRYFPVDVSRAAVEDSARILIEKFPGLHIHGLIADFLTQLHMIPSGARRFFCFFGSTLGNLERDQALSFCTAVASVMQPGDMLLLGLDMVKDRSVLEAAYNDSRNITAAFNRNILTVVNRHIDTDFNLSDFDHRAFYNSSKQRVEMHLAANKELVITSPYLTVPVRMRQGQTIHTENSHKFTESHVAQFTHSSGLEIRHVFTDQLKWFSLVYMVKP